MDDMGTAVIPFVIANNNLRGTVIHCIECHVPIARFEPGYSSMTSMDNPKEPICTVVWVAEPKFSIDVAGNTICQSCGTVQNILEKLEED